jgi:retinol dehydrogenase-14
MATTAPGSMADKTVLITGANSGIGLWTARGLASAGAEIIMVCRDRARGIAARDELARSAALPPDLLYTDLSVQASIHDLAHEIHARYDHLDVVVNNAGSVFDRRGLTIDGIERTFAVNHLAPFLLTNLLLDLLEKAPQGRVVTVTSEIHANKLDFENLQGEKSYRFLKAYSASKTGNILFTYELARRLRGTRVTANAVSPGPSRTGFGNNLKGTAAALPKIMKKMPFFHSAEKGARVVVYAAAEASLSDVTGKFFQNSKLRKSKPITYDTNVATELWDLSDQLTSSTTRTGW